MLWLPVTSPEHAVEFRSADVFVSISHVSSQYGKQICELIPYLHLLSGIGFSLYSIQKFAVVFDNFITTPHRYYLANIHHTFRYLCSIVDRFSVLRNLNVSRSNNLVIYGICYFIISSYFLLSL